MADPLKLHDLEFVPFISEPELKETVARLASGINRSYQGKCPLFIVVLNGAFIFASDLIRNITIECEISFLRVSSYRGTSSAGEVKEMMPVGTDVSGRDVILVEDIVDTGRTMGSIMARMKAEGAASVSICSLLFKPEVFEGDYPIAMVGKRIPDRFVVGYGLDYDGLGRNLPSIYQTTAKRDRPC